jgi:hypothetical protein
MHAVVLCASRSQLYCPGASRPRQECSRLTSRFRVASFCRAENRREVAPGRSVTFDSARSADFDSARSAALILIPRAARALTRHYSARICTGETLSPGSATRATSSEERKGGRAISFSLSLKRARQGPKEKRGIQIAAMHHARELAFSMLVI